MRRSSRFGFLEPTAPRPVRIPGAVAGVPVVPVLGIAGAMGLMMRTGWLAASICAAVLVLGAGVRVATTGRA